jgi:hypothetical protein
VATNTSHWKKYIYGRAAAICFLYDTRLRFLEKGKDTGKGAPMSCAMVYWGKNFDRFSEVFMPFGAVMNIENLRGITIGHAHNKEKVKQLALGDFVEERVIRQVRAAAS